MKKNYFEKRLSTLKTTGVTSAKLTGEHYNTMDDAVTATHGRTPVK